MTFRIPGAAKALIVLTAAGLLLSGCYVGGRAYHAGPHYGGPHFAQPHYGKHDDHRPAYKGKGGKHWKRGQHRRGWR